MCTLKLFIHLRTFFCNRTTLVHFLSSSPSYFLLVAASKLSPRFSSSRNAAALLGRLVDVRYAIIDLCLFEWSASVQKKAFRRFPQLLGLPRGQDLAHCSGGRGCIRLAGQIVFGIIKITATWYSVSGCVLEVVNRC